MNDKDEWASLQDAWGGDVPGAAPPGLPDVAAMIARARRQRRLTVWTIVAEWAMALTGLAIMAVRWPRLQTDGMLALWWIFFLLVNCLVMVGFTWTRLQALNEPAGASLRDWLQLRRRRALLGLRLAKFTRWTTVALLPAPLVALATARSDAAAAISGITTALVLAAGWLWARRKRARMNAEIAEVDALALEWLDEALASSGPTTT